MINFNYRKNGRTHWEIIYLPPLKIDETVSGRVIFSEWQLHATELKKYINTQAKFKIVVAELNNCYCISFCFKNAEQTYHGIFQVTNNKIDALNLAKCMNESVGYIDANAVKKDMN